MPAKQSAIHTQTKQNAENPIKTSTQTEHKKHYRTLLFGCFGLQIQALLHSFSLLVDQAKASYVVADVDCWPPKVCRRSRRLDRLRRWL